MQVHSAPRNANPFVTIITGSGIEEWMWKEYKLIVDILQECDFNGQEIGNSNMSAVVNS